MAGNQYNSRTDFSEFKQAQPVNRRPPRSRRSMDSQKSSKNSRKNLNGKMLDRVNPNYLKARQLRNYHKALVLPELRNLNKEREYYKERAIDLELENMKRRKLEADVPGQLESYLNEQRKKFNIVDLKVMDGKHLMGKKGPWGNRQFAEDFANGFGGLPGAQGFGGVGPLGGGMFKKKGEKPESSKQKGVINKDIRPIVNYKMIEPMDPIYDANKINKRIDEVNKERKRQYKEDMKRRREQIDYIREMMRNLPLPPDLPKIYSFTNKKNFPLDFNMTSHQIQQKNKKVVNKANARKINETVINPLKTTILKLRALRAEIVPLKKNRDELKNELLDLRDKIEDEEDSDEREGYIEEVELKKFQYKNVFENVNTKKKEILETREAVTVLKKQAVEMLQGLANKEYLTNPDNIFDFPENNKVRHLTKEINFGLKEALDDLDMKEREAELAKRNEEMRERLRREAERNQSTSSSSSSSEVSDSK
jgi:hypothetical protein